TLETMLDAVDREPLCRASIPNPIARRDVAASTLFNVIDVGDVLTVVDVDGGTREVVAPARSEQPRSCSDPLTRASRVHVRDVYQRDDGVVVVVLPTLGSHSEHPFPPNMDTAAYAAWIAEGVQAIGDEVAAFDDDVTGLIYDLRGNVGGSAEFGMALLAQLTDVEGSIGNCFARAVGSDPVRYDDDVEYPFPYAALDGASMPAPPITRLPAGTKQAVLTDGLTYSAGDWMAYHAHQLGIDVVGTPAAGAFGYTVGDSFVIDPIVAANDEHLDIINFISGAHCVYGADATSMEGNSVVDVEVTFDAADLAAGIDTQLEAAVDVVLR
ncbi:MAG TPA: S41 family peptidase, partial [Myxococcota bacterium]